MSSITTSTTLSTDNISLYSFPITISGGTSINPVTITIGSDLIFTQTSLSTPSAFFIIGSDYVRIDGQNHLITLTPLSSSSTTTNGLIRNGTSAANGKSNVTIENIGCTIFGTNLSLASSAGYICQSYFGKGSSDVSITNCYSTGLIGSVINTSVGGICGANCGNSSGNVSITNCYSTGTISGRNSGGIVGGNCGSSSGIITITKCYSTGTITGLSIGGIVGGDCCVINGNVTITYCYSTGEISGTSCGGICGISCGTTNGTATITNCYSSGNISGNFSGGIVGQNFGLNTNNTCAIINCYSDGSITGSDAGGIVGANIGRNTLTGINSVIPKINIINCYNLNTSTTESSIGSICGGINLPSYTNIPVITISNCYTLSSPFVSANLTSNVANAITITSCFADTVWTATNAINYLLNTPTYNLGVLTNPIGTVWTDINTTVGLTPWLFSSLGYSPYTNTLTTTFSQTIEQGQSTISALVPSTHTFTIVSINNSLPSNYPSISIIGTDNTTGGTINTSVSTPTGTYNIVILQQSDYTMTNFNLTINALCFVKGTRILILENFLEISKPIEELKVGDLVKTYSNGYKPIKLIIENKFQNNPLARHKCLYKYNNLWVTGSHKLLVENDENNENNCLSKSQMARTAQIEGLGRIPAYKDARFTRVKNKKIYDIYNIVLEGQKTQYGIYAEGILAETASYACVTNKN
jgi:hypothetical protein